jgi:hypothetical protein
MRSRQAYFVRFDKRTETPVFEVPIINTDEVKEYLSKSIR